VSDAAAREILIVGARALAHADGLGPTLEILIGSIAEQLEIGSAAILIVTEQAGRYPVAASFGIGESAVAGLEAAVANPDHPIARTVVMPVPTFDVQPTAPGGPALRSHLPLIVRRDGRDVMLGVLALAHDRPIDPNMRPLILAGADLAAIALERHRTR
jgi:hypothetical protein